MSRLASLSTPSRARSGQSPSPAPSPNASNASLTAETTHHRMLKLVLAEIKAVHRTWDDLVGVDGLKAGKGIVDASTAMDNLLTSAPDERPPIAVHLTSLVEQRAALQGVLSKLNKTLNKLSLLVEQAEKIYFDAYRLQGAQWVDEEPMWLTWSLRRFIDSLPPLITVHNHNLTTLTSLSNIILAPQTTFDLAKLTLERWRDLSMGGERWESVREWEELVELEMTWGGVEVQEEEVGTPGGKGKKKGKR